MDGERKASLVTFGFLGLLYVDASVGNLAIGVTFDHGMAVSFSDSVRTCTAGLFWGF